MGIIQLSEIAEAPEEGYIDYAPVIIGHSYTVRNNAGRYAKLQVTYIEGAEVGETSVLVNFNWIFQERDIRRLRH